MSGYNNFSKGSAMPVIVSVVAILVVLGGVVYYNTRPEGEIMMDKGQIMLEEGGEMVEGGESMIKEGEKMMEDGKAMMDGGNKDEVATGEFVGKVISGSGSPLLEFNEADYKKAVASDRLVVLYFYASWCPICKKEFKDTEKVFGELEDEQVVGFRVHFNDSETSDAQKELAREFGVGYQHTKVFIKNGERVLKSPESWSIERYRSEINKHING
jgi:thiol-disulfide isomerase/thioredoxin